MTKQTELIVHSAKASHSDTITTCHNRFVVGLIRQE